MSTRKKAFQDALEKMEQQSEESATRKRVESLKEKRIIASELTQKAREKEIALKEKKDLAAYEKKSGLILYFFTVGAVALFLNRLAWTPSERTRFIVNAIILFFCGGIGVAKYMKKK